jgi:hypothetical protein
VAPSLDSACRLRDHFPLAMGWRKTKNVKTKNVKA